MVWKICMSSLQLRALDPRGRDEGYLHDIQRLKKELAAARRGANSRPRSRASDDEVREHIQRQGHPSPGGGGGSVHAASWEPARSLYFLPQGPTPPPNRPPFDDGILQGVGGGKGRCQPVAFFQRGRCQMPRADTSRLSLEEG